MESRFYLNNYVASIVDMPARQILSLTEKGLVIPVREAMGAGTKRGYDYVNLLEFALAKQLLEMGHGVQSVKTILFSLREFNLIREWAEDHIKFFRQYWKIGGGIFNFLPSNWDGSSYRSGKLDDSFRVMFGLEPLNDSATGVIFYFFGGSLNRKAIIVPQTRFTELDKLAEALKRIYGVVINQRGALVINIGRIKEDIDEALKDHGLI